MRMGFGWWSARKGVALLYLYLPYTSASMPEYVNSNERFNLTSAFGYLRSYAFTGNGWPVALGRAWIISLRGFVGAIPM